MRQHGKHHVHAISMDNERVEDCVIKKIQPELQWKSADGSQRRDAKGRTRVVSTKTLRENPHHIVSEGLCRSQKLTPHLISEGYRRRMNFAVHQ